MSTVIIAIGALWIVLGLIAFLLAWFRLQSLSLPPGETASQRLTHQLLVAEVTAVELVLAVLLLSFGVLFIFLGMPR